MIWHCPSTPFSWIMALQIISVLLFTVFFSEALTLRCYNCITTVPPGTCTQTANCTSQSAQCSSITTYSAIVNSVKNCSASCGVNWSVNIGQFGMTSQCCDSDLCNNAADSFNGMMCYTCNAANCSNTLACKGDERKCITATAELVGINNTTTTLKGCASKTICDNSALVSVYLQQANIRIVSCCDGQLCNSAQSLTQGVVLLLVPLLPLLFSI